MKGEASWLGILFILVVVAGIGAFWLREKLEERREHRH